MKYLIILGVLSFPFISIGQFGLTQHVSKTNSLELHYTDIDGDNDVDLVASDNVTWYENMDGNGLFKIRQVLSNSTSDNVRQIDSGDIDGDGDIDLLVADQDFIHWYENIDGLGYFVLTQEVVESNVDISNITLFDKDEDGDLDILFYWGQQDVIAWIANTDGEGLFGTMETILDLPNNINGYDRFQLHDIDGDNDKDIVYQFSEDNNPPTTTLSWIENIDGTFGTLNSIATEDEFQLEMRCDDLDSDGDIDIVVSTTSGAIKFYKNTNGVFSAGIILKEEVYNLYDINLSDVDNDNDLDVLVVKDYSWQTTYEREIFWFENIDGQGNLSDKNLIVSLGENFTPRSILTPDVNGDGFDDIILGSFYDAQISYWKNETGQGNFEPQQIIAFEDNNSNVLSIDMDGDEDIDLISFGSSSTKYYKNIGDSLFIATPNYLLNINGSHTIAGDINGDGLADIISAAGTSNNTDLFLVKQSDSIGTFESKEVIAIGKIRGLTFWDFDEDGDNDVLIATPEGLYTLHNTDGLGTFEFEMINNDFFVSDVDLLFEDMDNDGLKDIIANHYIYRNEGGSLNFAAQEIVDTNISEFDIRSMVVADMNNDMWKDIVLSVNSGTTLIWKENLGGTNGFGADQIITNGNYALGSLSVGDVDSDGDLDVLAAGRSEVEFFKVRVFWYENNSGFSLNNANTIYISKNNITPSLTVNDLDNDGDIDVALNVEEVLYYENFIGDAQVEGVCFFDENANGVFDNNESTLWNQSVTLMPIGFQSWTTSQGKFSFVTTVGQHTLEYNDDPNWKLTTDPIYTFNLATLSDYFTFNFGLQPDSVFKDISPILTSQAFRCHEVSTFWLDLKNTGTQKIDGQVKVVLDDKMNFVNASTLPDAIDGDTLFWNYQDLSPTHNDLFAISVQIPDETNIGLPLELVAMVDVLGALDTVVIADTIGYISEVICSYDPNDKLVSPDPEGEENFTIHGDTLEYTIRFQNTGNAPAKNITILDDLNFNLDWFSFTPVSSSHPYEVFITDYFLETPLRFEFKNINLPDSLSNEPESHGFVKFRILPKENLPDNTVIYNSAEIYFDNNPPIITNTVVITFVSFSVDFETQDQCVNDSQGSIAVKNIIGVPPFSYLWSNNSTEDSIANLSAGNYFLTITDGDGAEFLYDFTIDPLVFTGLITSTPEEDNTSNGSANIDITDGMPPYTYSWNTTPVQTTASISGLSAGEYEVTVTDADGCTLVESITVETITDIAELDLINTFNVFPNPSNSDFSIVVELMRADDFKIEITNSLGQVEEAFEIKNNNTFSEFIEVENFGTGIYFINLKLKDKMITKRISILP